MRRTLLLMGAVALTCALWGCAPKAEERSSKPVSAADIEATAEAPEADKFIAAFDEVVPTSANEKAVASKAGTFYDAWKAYKLNISPDADLPTLEELGGNNPKFIGYCVAAYSGRDPDGNGGQFDLIVSGEQLGIAPEIGWKEAIDLTDESTLSFFSTRTPLDSWDSDPHHEPQSPGEKAAVNKMQDFVETLPKDLLFTKDRVRLKGYTFFWGKSPGAPEYVIMTVQPGENKHYAATNYSL